MEIKDIPIACDGIPLFGTKSRRSNGERLSDVVENELGNWMFPIPLYFGQVDVGTVSVEYKNGVLMVSINVDNDAISDMEYFRKRIENYDSFILPRFLEQSDGTTIISSCYISNTQSPWIDVIYLNESWNKLCTVKLKM